MRSKYECCLAILKEGGGELKRCKGEYSAAGRVLGGVQYSREGIRGVKYSREGIRGSTVKQGEGGDYMMQMGIY